MVGSSNGMGFASQFALCSDVRVSKDGSIIIVADQGSLRIAQIKCGTGYTTSL